MKNPESEKQYKNICSFRSAIRYFVLCFLTLSFQLSTFKCFAQSPQYFQYQAVVRDASGTAMVSQPVNFQVSIISGSITGTVEYIETHTASTNTFGVVTLNIGSGNASLGTFSGIIWGIASHYIKVEADPTGGTSYLDMGTTQLLSVPYSLYSEKAGNIPTYTGGAGIDVTGTIISNTSPDQNVTLTQGGATTITGTYPSFTISSTDLNSGTPGGLNKTIQFNNSGSFNGDTALIWDNTNKRLGVGLTNPIGRMVVQGSATASDTLPLFEVKNSSGQTIFVVYPDSVHIYVKDGGAKSNRGGFAVSGRNNSKAFTNNYLTVTPDSTRIFTGDTISGFGVENLGSGSTTSYLHLTPSNYFIGHQAGDSITSGLYNSFMGYQSGKLTSSGYKNTFLGYKTGLNNLIGYSNVFIGVESGYNNLNGSRNVFLGEGTGYYNTSGSENVFLGMQSGHNNITGNSNTFLGAYSGLANSTGNANTFIGFGSGQANTTGDQNSFIGSYSGFSNNVGNHNLFVGNLSGYFNTSGSENMFIGFQAGHFNTIGQENMFIGYLAGNKNTTGNQNTFIGRGTGFNNTTGANNIFIGNWSGFNSLTSYDNIGIGINSAFNITDGYKNTFVGNNSGRETTSGSYNAFYGIESGLTNTTGNANSFFGYQAGNNVTTGSSNSFFGEECGWGHLSGTFNCFFGSNAGRNNQTGSNNVLMGYLAGNGFSGSNNVYVGFAAGGNATGSNNVFLGYGAGFSETGSNKLFIANQTGTIISGDFISGNIGIGTLSPSAKLDVIGKVKITDGTEATGKVLTSDATGTASWEFPVNNKDEVVLVTHNTYGTINTTVPRFSTVLSNIGSAMNYIDSPTEGTTVVISKSGLYYVSMEIKQTWNSNSTATWGIMKNTGSDPGMNSLNRLCFEWNYESLSTAYHTSSSTVYLDAGDVVRPFYDSTQNNESRFEIRRVN